MYECAFAGVSVCLSVSVSVPISVSVMNVLVRLRPGLVCVLVHVLL